MAYGETAPELAPCSFCGYANWAGAARCLQCGLPVDLVQCAACEAVNRSESAMCSHCGAALPPLDAHRAEHRLLNSTLSPPNRRGDTLGSYLGFGMLLAAVGCGVYALFVVHGRDSEDNTQFVLPARIAIVAITGTDALRTPPLIEIAVPPASQVSAAPVIVSKRPRVKVHTASAAHSAASTTQSFAMERTGAAPQVGLVAATGSRRAPELPAPSSPGRQPYCTGADVANHQCRPEQLWTGQ